MSDRFPRNQERTARIGLEDGVPLFEAEFFKGSRIKYRGVVDKQIEPPEPRDSRGDCLAD